MGHAPPARGFLGGEGIGDLLEEALSDSEHLEGATHDWGGHGVGFELVEALVERPLLGVRVPFLLGRAVEHPEEHLGRGCRVVDPAPDLREPKLDPEVLGAAGRWSSTGSVHRKPA